MDAKDLHNALLRPETYPEPTGPIEFRETHISRLYFTDQHVYKIKKPVDFGFLNFTSLDRRRFYCEEEVRLNRRFCPDTYLGIVDIRREGEQITLGGKGEVIEYAVWMKKLPEERMLDRLLKTADPFLPREMERTAQRIAQLHRESDIVYGNGGRNDLDTVRFNWQENLTQTAPGIGNPLSARAHAIGAAWVDGFLTDHAALLLRRQAAGFVRDGHGDLHVEHICLTDPVRIYDCIEFNRRLRVADVAADLAFLLMDLDFRGRRDLAALTLESYRAALPEDHDLPLLLPFYKIYRAWVRGKVMNLLAGDAKADAGVRAAASESALRYFNLALGYISPPALLLTCGLMGVGKSTISRELAWALDAQLMRSDELRKAISGLAPTTRRPEPFGSGIYTAEVTRRTYDALLDRAMAALSAGDTVIVDASFAHRTERDRFAEAAAQAGLPCLLIHMECPEETALERLDRRQGTSADASDGRREIFSLQSAVFDPVNDSGNVIRVDTSKEVDYNVHFLLCELIERIGMRR
jgi:hypothetical protein